MNDAQRKAMYAKKKNDVKYHDGQKVRYHGKDMTLSLKLPKDRTGKNHSVGVHSLKPNEKITLVVFRNDRDELARHYEDEDGHSIYWNGQKAREEQQEMAKRMTQVSFRTGYKNGLQHNRDPKDFLYSGDST